MKENKILRAALMPFAQIEDVVNDADCTVWKRNVAAGDVRMARKLVLANVAISHARTADENSNLPRKSGS